MRCPSGPAPQSTIPGAWFSDPNTRLRLMRLEAANCNLTGPLPANLGDGSLSFVVSAVALVD